MLLGSYQQPNAGLMRINGGLEKLRDFGTCNAVAGQEVAWYRPEDDGARSRPAAVNKGLDHRASSVVRIAPATAGELTQQTVGSGTVARA
jgi:hypothetical protein